MKRIVSLLCFAVFAFAGVRSVDIVPEEGEKTASGIRILDQKELLYATVKGYPFTEISDIAYLPKREKLFMISDEGILFVFRARFSDKIDLLEPLAAAPLTKKGGKPFKKWRRDSEGLTLDAKGRLLVSFEGKPKIGWFHKNSDKIGQRIKKYSLPEPLRNPKHYRTRNKSLEALAWHPKYGVLTVAEWPLKRDHKKRQTIYSLRGKRWHFKAEPEGKSAVSAIEVTDSGDLLVLERSFTGYLDPFVVTLKIVDLHHCKKGWCPSRVLAKMSTHRGWGVDNFEGLARVGKNRFLMISDDNGNFFQRTLLIYFEVKQ